MSARTKKPTPVAHTPPAQAFDDVDVVTYHERAARSPLKYSATLAAFHCFCGRPHTPSTELVRCDCGRGWIQEPKP